MSHASIGEPVEESKSQKTQRIILERAIDRFGRDGYRSTSVATISRDAGVSGSLAYAYFADKEALFRAALDYDAGEVIRTGIVSLTDSNLTDLSWRDDVVRALIEALDSHALTRRVLAGLEPHVTSQMLDLPALEELRVGVAKKLTEGQASGTVRPDIDPASIGRGLVNIWISLLMGVVQFGMGSVASEAPYTRAVLEAATAPLPG